VARAVLVHAFDNALRLLQPIIPFIAETLWAKLPAIAGGVARGGDFLCTSAWPVVRVTPLAGGDDFEIGRKYVLGGRQVRSDNKVKPSQRIVMEIRPTRADAAATKALASLIGDLVRANVTVVTEVNGVVTRDVTVQVDGVAAMGEIGVISSVVAGGGEIIVPVSSFGQEISAADTAKECARLKTELESTQKILAGVQSKLGNESFTSRAKPDVVEGARAQERDLLQKVESLTRKVEALCGTA
jgi:valyl-tRNA synthetase